MGLLPEMNGFVCAAAEWLKYTDVHIVPGARKAVSSSVILLTKAATLLGEIFKSHSLSELGSSSNAFSGLNITLYFTSRNAASSAGAFMGS